MLHYRYDIFALLIHRLIEENIPFTVVFEKQDKPAKLSDANKYQHWYTGTVVLNADATFDCYCGKDKLYKPGLTLTEAYYELWQHYEYNAQDEENDDE